MSGVAAWSGRIWIAGAAVLWSTSGFFAKAPWFDSWPEEDRGMLLAFYRSLFAVLILVPLIRRPCWRWQILPMVTCFALMVWTFMSAMVAGPAANAIWLQYLSPAWVLVAGVVLMKEKVSVADIRMLVFGLGGVLLILVMEFKSGGNLYATVMGVLSGVTFAGVVLSMRSLRDVDSAWLITLNHLGAIVLLAPWVISGGHHTSLTSYVALGFFGVFQMSIPYLMFARGLRDTSGHEAAVLALLEPVLVPVWVFIAWRHHPSYDPLSWWTWVGAGMICVGLVSRYLPAVLRGTRAFRRRPS